MYALTPHTQKENTSLSFNVTDIEGTELLSCTDTLTIRLVLAGDTLDKKIPSSA